MWMLKEINECTYDVTIRETERDLDHFIIFDEGGVISLRSADNNTEFTLESLLLSGTE